MDYSSGEVSIFEDERIPFTEGSLRKRIVRRAAAGIDAVEVASPKIAIKNIATPEKARAGAIFSTVTKEGVTGDAGGRFSVIVKLALNDISLSISLESGVRSTVYNNSKVALVGTRILGLYPK